MHAVSICKLQYACTYTCSFQQNGCTPLSLAAQYGKDEIVGYLLEVKKVPIKIPGQVYS